MRFPAVPTENKEQARWFAEQVLPHEPMLRAWLASQFPDECDIDDIVQEAFMRLLEAQAQAGIRSPKAYLFVTARNIARMQYRHRQVERADSLTEIGGAAIHDEGADVRDAVLRAQELELLSKAIRSLPTRCRQVITLRRIYGLSLREVAAELGITEHTVEIQSAIGLRKIGRYLARFRLQPLR